MEKLLSYKPSTFYFRAALRETDEHGQLVRIVGALQAEIELCYDFARSNGIRDTYDGDGRLFELPRDPNEVRTLGLELCCRLEDVKRTIRDHGLIPPKKNIMRSEARDKGWEIGA